MTDLFTVSFSGLFGIVFVVGLLYAIEIVGLGLLRILGVYTVVGESEARVYVLFGNVLGVIKEPGLHFLYPQFGWQAVLQPLFGKTFVRSLKLDQAYLRSTPVNSEEGAPMGIGVWYEMAISDPVAHVFRNTDARGSLAASVSNATVKCLSNMGLDEMLESRHQMSMIVRNEVSPQSQDWGYRLGSVYIRKVHFRDQEMIHQIEAKVVNRLRQVTSAIRQEGNNQVNIIASTAEANASVEFARAAARRPEIVGRALNDIAKDQEVSRALFDVLETKQLLESGAKITLIKSPKGSGGISQLLAARPGSME